MLYEAHCLQPWHPDIEEHIWTHGTVQEMVPIYQRTFHPGMATSTHIYIGPCPTKHRLAVHPLVLWLVPWFLSSESDVTSVFQSFAGALIKGKRCTLSCMLLRFLLTLHFKAVHRGTLYISGLYLESTILHCGRFRLCTTAAEMADNHLSKILNSGLCNGLPMAECVIIWIVWAHKGFRVTNNGTIL